jgi:lipopolysaccharide exporter
MTTVRRSLGFAFLERYLLIALQLVSFTLLARLLTPQQIGVYSVSMALVSITQVLRDFGLANYLIQRKELSDEDIGSALGMSLLLGAGLFITVNLIAPWVGQFYNESNLVDIVRIISLNFLILPFNSLSIALMRRAMRFDQLMRINVAAAVVSASITLGLAWSGAGSVSLAWGDIGSSLTLALGLSFYGAWGRLVRPRLSRWREILAFGGPVTVANVVTTVSQDINDLAVGKLMSLEQVAISSRAQGLMNLFNRDIMGTVRTVAYPAFARVVREQTGDAASDKAELEKRFRESLTAVTAFAWPFYGFLAFFSLEVLRLLFGLQWDACAPLVPIYCMAGAASALNGLIPTLLLAAGESKLVASADLIIQPVKAALLVGVIAIWQALEPLAWGFLVMAVLAVPYFFAFKQRRLPTDFAALARALGPNVLLTLMCILPSALIGFALRPAGQPLALGTWLGCALLTGLLWLAGLRLLRHPLDAEVRRVLSRLRGGQKSGSDPS